MREGICHTLNKNWEKDFKLEFRVYSLGLRLTMQSAEPGVLSKLLFLRCSEFWIMTASYLAFSRLGRWSGGCSLSLSLNIAGSQGASLSTFHSQLFLSPSQPFFFFFFFFLLAKIFPVRTNLDLLETSVPWKRRNKVLKTLLTYSSRHHLEI